MFQNLRSALTIGAMAIRFAIPQVECLNSSDQTGGSQQASSAGHYISVLLLDGKNGKPITDEWVMVRNARGNRKLSQTQSAQSNSRGIAEVFLADPIPERVGISFGALDFASCSDVAFLTDQILHSGIVARNTCADPKVYSSHSPVVGQIVIFGRRITLWDRILQEFL
jgi:hypothetical protein